MTSFMPYAYLYKYYPKHFAFMVSKMRETEIRKEKELHRPFSVISSNPKYNSIYLVHIVKNKWIGILNELEANNV